MRTLLVYPKYPDTFWSFKYALKFISKKAVNPPLGLITVSSMLPQNWNKRLIDMNVEMLKEKHIKWADCVFISAMSVQLESVKEVIKKCKKRKKRIICGGPLFTEDPELFPEVDYLVLNEAETTLPEFLNDLENGNSKRIYTSENYADLSTTPLPDYSLLKISRYNTMNIQLTRGCPFSCDFCDITALFGKKVRIKNTLQILTELEVIYKTGWRRNVFFVDDNFIGNKTILKNEILPALIKWMEVRNFPFSFATEASINLADDDVLMNRMTAAGFSTVFIGIETTALESLQECGKLQNTNRNLVESVHKIQQKGLEVNGGFILGFDSDTPSVFQQQIDFIKESGIISAMVGLLNAPKRTRLYKRLKNEGRILNESTGNNTDFTLNFTPKMDKKLLLEGYSKVIKGIYGGGVYYNRVWNLLKRFTPNMNKRFRFSLKMLVAFFRAHFRLGIIDSYRIEYWRLIIRTLTQKPRLLPLAITYSVYGFHFRKIFRKVL